MTLKEIKERARSVNLELREMDFSTEEIQDFWRECLDEATAHTKKPSEFMKQFSTQQLN